MPCVCRLPKGVFRCFLLCCFFALALSGCGGGGGAPTLTPPPESDSGDGEDAPLQQPAPPAPPESDSGGGDDFPRSPPPPPSPPGSIDLGKPATLSVGVDYSKDNEYKANYFNRSLGTEASYQRGYWGQNVTVAVLDTGVLTTHSDLNDNLLPGLNFAPGETINIFPVSDAGHGTYVAGIVGAERNGKRMQGVAPSVSILPIRACCVPRTDILAAFAAALSVSPILNNSWGYVNKLEGNYEGHQYTATIPVFKYHQHEGFHQQASRIKNLVRRKDAVFVWANGNNYWHEGGEIPLETDSSYTYAPIQDFIDNFTFTDGASLSVSLAEVGVTPSSSGFFPGLPIEHPDLAKKWLAVVAAFAYTSRPRLATAFIILNFSNSCGETKFWCLAAPGRRIASTYVNEETGEEKYLNSQGTSAAAPIVSGALALLKSRWTTMPMEVIRAILLTTATDLGEPGIDDLYGWGLVNIGRAVTLQGNVVFNPDLVTGAGTRLLETRFVLPPPFAGLRAQLDGTSVAVAVGGAHYNMKLSDIVALEPPAEDAAGHAAADMLSSPTPRVAGAFFAAHDMDGRLRAAGVNMALPGLGKWQMRHDFCAACRESAWDGWDEELSAAAPLFAGGGESFLLRGRGDGLRPFFSFNGRVGDEADAPYRQIGLRWQKQLPLGGGARFRILTEASVIDEPNSVWGADFGGAGEIGMRSHQRRVVLSGALGERWRGGGMVENMRGEDAAGNGLFSALSGLNAHGWGAFLEKRGLFGNGDKLRLTARREMRVTSGKALLRYRRATGDFTEAFYAGVAGAPAALKGKQTLETHQTTAEISAEGRQFYALGYMFNPSPQTRAALAAEVAAGGGAAFSAQWRAQF